MVESTEKLVALKIEPSSIVIKVELPPAEYKYQRMKKVSENFAASLILRTSTKN